MKIIRLDDVKQIAEHLEKNGDLGMFIKAFPDENAVSWLRENGYHFKIIDGYTTFSKETSALLSDEAFQRKITDAELQKSCSNVADKMISSFLGGRGFYGNFSNDN